MKNIAPEIWAIALVGLIAFVLILANLRADLTRRKELSRIRRKL